MTVDAQTQALLDQGKGQPQLHELSVEEARVALKEMTLFMDIEQTEVGKRIERVIPGPHGDIPIRIYWPNAQKEGEKLPVLLLYHGGGFALGDMDTHENVARYYCKHGHVIVVNVDYRLAPENPFPKGIDDAYAALEWASENADTFGGDKDCIAVTGDSAGGNISAALTQMAQKRGGPAICYQILVYPGVDFRATADYPSRQAYGGGDYFLSTDSIKWLSGMYLRDKADAADSHQVSPILYDHFSTLPPALIITAGYDILLDEGELYATRLKDAGVSVEYKCFDSTIHGFMSFAGAISAGREGLDLVAKTLKEKLPR